MTSSATFFSNNSVDTNFYDETTSYAPARVTKSPFQHTTPTQTRTGSPSPSSSWADIASEDKQAVEDYGEGSDNEQSTLDASDIEGLSLLFEDLSPRKTHSSVQNTPEMPSGPYQAQPRTRTPLYSENLVNRSDLMPHSRSISSQASLAHQLGQFANESDAEEMKHPTDWQYFGPVSSISGFSQTETVHTPSSRPMVSQRDLPLRPASRSPSTQPDLGQNRMPLSTYPSSSHFSHASSSSQISNISFDQVRGEPLTPASSVASDSKAQTPPAQLFHDRAMPVSDTYGRTVSPPFPMRLGGSGNHVLQNRSERMPEPNIRPHTAQNLSRAHQGFATSKSLNPDIWHELPDTHYVETPELAGTGINRNYPKPPLLSSESRAEEAYELPG